MPIYEYRSVSGGCEYCRRRFEVRQGMNEAPLTSCPRCGAPVRKLFSRPFICTTEPVSENERLVKHTEEETDRLGLTDGFAEDRIYE
mgnify:CR=1 FL=1